MEAALCAFFRADALTRVADRQTVLDAQKALRNQSLVHDITAAANHRFATGDAGCAAPLTRLTGEEIAPRGSPLADARTAAKAWFDAHLRPFRLQSQALGRQVGFNRVGRDKFISESADPRKIALLAAVRDVIERGRLLRSEPPKDPGYVNIKAVHHMVGSVDLAGEPLTLRVVVRETKAGDFYYTHYIEDDPASPDARFSPATKRGDGTPGGGTASDMAPPAQTVNRSAAVIAAVHAATATCSNALAICAWTSPPSR